jgi:hypothetical protein
MELLLEQLIDWFELPRNGLASVFLVALVSTRCCRSAPNRPSSDS